MFFSYRQRTLEPSKWQCVDDCKKDAHLIMGTFFLFATALMVILPHCLVGNVRRCWVSQGRAFSIAVTHHRLWFFVSNIFTNSTGQVVGREKQLSHKVCFSVTELNERSVRNTIFWAHNNSRYISTYLPGVRVASRQRTWRTRFRWRQWP